MVAPMMHAAGNPAGKAHREPCSSRAQPAPTCRKRPETRRNSVPERRAQVGAPHRVCSSTRRSAPCSHATEAPRRAADVQRARAARARVNGCNAQPQPYGAETSEASGQPAQRRAAAGKGATHHATGAAPAALERRTGAASESRARAFRGGTRWLPPRRPLRPLICFLRRDPPVSSISTHQRRPPPPPPAVIVTHGTAQTTCNPYVRALNARSDQRTPTAHRAP